MSAGADNDGRELELPPGFEIVPARALDPIFGAVGQWAYRGTVDGATARGSGYRSREDARLAAWRAFGA